MEETAFSDLECTFDEKEVIVVDTGSGFTKVGYSGCDVPARVIPTAAFQDAITRGSSYDDSSSLGRNTSYGSRSSTAEAQGVKLYGEQAVEAYVNSSSHHPTARKELRRPILRGEIIDKDDLEAFWDHTLRQIVRPSKRGRDGSVSLEDFPVLLTDCPSSTAVATASNQQLVGVGGNSFTRAWMAELRASLSSEGYARHTGFSRICYPPCYLPLE
ncbi:Actin-like 6A [Perkinsus olseni]|uniref:Actin-like 6A n=1 Tax=Perkinsus olseni TaxID=32597 RepID=A0A7J6R8U4_PEROL|nr:Actin-like 6A [Perkinsus olseni]